MTVTLPYDTVWTALDWAKEHCASYISNEVHGEGYNNYDINQIDYHFADAADAVMFALRWS